jgi:hypothetical protein
LKPDFDIILELKSGKVSPEAVNGKYRSMLKKIANGRFYQ